MRFLPLFYLKGTVSRERYDILSYVVLICAEQFGRRTGFTFLQSSGKELWFSKWLFCYSKSCVLHTLRILHCHACQLVSVQSCSCDTTLNCVKSKGEYGLLKMWAFINKLYKCPSPCPSRQFVWALFSPHSTRRISN